MCKLALRFQLILCLAMFSPFHSVTDACLYNWSSSKDLEILTTGRVFPPSNVPENQPHLTLPARLGRQKCRVCRVLSYTFERAF